MIGYSWRMVAASLTLVLSVTAAPLSAQQIANDSVLSAVQAAQSEFFATWAAQWAKSQAAHHSLVLPSTGQRAVRTRRPDGTVVVQQTLPGTGGDTAMFTASYPVRRVATTSCGMFEGSGEWKNPRRTGDWPSMALGSGWSISSRVTPFNVCPTWYLGPERMPPYDERLSLDFAIAPEFQSTVRKARERLINVLESALRSDTTNDWLAGQVVRMHVDQGSGVALNRILETCAATPWWCNLLRGYTEAMRGSRAQAELLYQRGLADMPAEHRCAFTDVAELLEAKLRTTLVRTSCTTRDSVSAVVWWLADPLWSEPGNDRFVEHITRRMLLQLRTASSHDERFDWRPEAGSDARAELVMRYGWPAFMYWGGRNHDSTVSSLLRLRRHPSPPNAPYVSYEYGAGRLHLLPSSRSILEPLWAEASDWNLSAPFGGDTVIHFKLTDVFRRSDRSPEAAVKHWRNGDTHSHWINVVYPRYVRETLWWPEEHYAAPRKLVPLRSPEVAFLRREQTAVMAVALPLDSLDRNEFGPDGRVAIVRTSHPESVQVVASSDGTARPHVVLQASIAAAPALLGVEIVDPDRPIAARTRFGIRPPSPLSALPADSIAVSDPVLLRTSPPPEQHVLRSAQAALDQMMPTAVVARGTSFGLFWETYGVPAGDSVRIGVVLQRYTPGSILNRLRRAVGAGGNVNTPVQISWTETGGNLPPGMLLDGATPVVGRTLRIDASRLPVGDYRVIVNVNSRGLVARSQKAVRVR